MDEQAQQVIGQLQLQVQQQQAQLQQQHSHQVALLAQLASSSIPMSAPPSTSRPVVKPKPPSTFLAGDKTGELDQWEREMRYQFVAYGHALSSGEARIAFAASYLDAAVAAGFTQYSADVTSVAGYAWPVILLALGIVIAIKLVKRFANKV